jgi:hypothetical protein
MKLFNLMQTAYQNFDTTVNNYLSKVMNSLGMAGTHSQIFKLIFDGIKGVMQNAMFYIEDALTEQNIFTATRKKSFYSLAKVSGYEPFYGSSATGTIICSLIRANVFDQTLTKLFIPNHSKIKNKETGHTYILELKSNKYVIDLNKPLTNHEFKVIEGTFLTNWFNAVGADFEKFSIMSTQLFDRNYVKVFVNNKEYTVLECIYDMTENSEECVLTTGYDNNFDIIFGNGVYGRKLNSGDNVKIEWLSHHGKEGNILTNTKYHFVWESSGSDAAGNSIDLNKYTRLQMSTCVSGGIDDDSIDVIKNMIGYNSRALVLATEDNFKLFFKRFSFIGKVNCWSEENSMYMIVSCLSSAISDANSIDEYKRLALSDLYINDEQKDQIINTLSNSNKTFAGVSLKFINPIIRRYAIICFIKADDAYNKDYIKESIENELIQYFISLPDNTLKIYKSDLIMKVINGCPNVKSFDFMFVSELAEQTFKQGYFEKPQLTLANNTFHETTVKVFYEKDSQPGLDEYGNIELYSKLEIPLLQGGFNYYPNKENQHDNSSIKIETIQYIFI